MREKLLNQLADWHARYPLQIILVVIMLSLIFSFFSTQLTITMRWSDLLPEKDPRTIEYNQIIREFTSASNIVVVAQGEGARMKEFADTLAPRLLTAVDTSKNTECLKKIKKLKSEISGIPKTKHVKIQDIQIQIQELQNQMNFSLIQRVDYKNPVEFMKNHGLMLMKAEDLRDNQSVFENPNLPELIHNINEALEKEYVGQPESISSREKEDQAILFLDAVEHLTQTLYESTQGAPPDADKIRESADRLLIGDPYFLSYDQSALIMIAVPNFSALELDRMVSGTDAVQAVLDRTLSEFPDIQAGLTGMIPIGRDEMVYGMESANVTSIIALFAILILLILAFRMWVAPLFAILNLLIGLLWAIGLTAMTVGQLNIMTQMMAVILLGLGIDFSIHFISGFTENRSSGQSIAESLKLTFQKYGKGIMTGGLTTSFAFLSLMISSSRGMKEMGLVTGLGLIAVLITTFLALPAFLVLRERRIQRKTILHVRRDISFRFLGKTGALLGNHFLLTFIISWILTTGMIWHASRITFDQNYMNMEPEGLPSVMLQDTITDKFDLSMDYALVLSSSPDESRNLATSYRKLATTAMTEDIGLYLPSAQEQDERSGIIQKIKNKMTQAPVKHRLSASDLTVLQNEIQRLDWNIMEIQDMAFLNGQERVEQKCARLVGSPDSNAKNRLEMLHHQLNSLSTSQTAELTHYQQIFAPYFKQQVMSMANTESITLEKLPASILDRYSNPDRTRFLVSVYPKASIWTDLKFLVQFTEDLSRVNNRATGMPTIFQALIEIIGRDGRNALVLTLLVVFLLLWLDFKRPQYALIAMTPLILGVIWMVGLMRIFGLQFTVINVMGLPMIIGIGIDDGVHIMHRWIHEGKRNLYQVFSSTGKAILLTTLTTMLAFGSLYFAVWRGFASLGSALFLGVGACFITTLLFLSCIIGMLTRQ
ncbi:MMPL family transporter [bacterium]|nr:MMPL family transporter [bacterium]